MQFHSFPVRTVEGLISIEHGLHDVLACGKVLKAVDWVAGRACIYDRRLAGPPAIDCHAKDDLRTWRVIDLHPRFLVGVSREKQQQPSIHRLRASLRGKSHGE